MEREFLQDLMYQLIRLRRFEERTLEVLVQGKLASTMCHVAVGQEAVAVGVCAALAKQDYITSTHRGHGHLIARGGDINRMMAELMGKETGYCKGRGGSMHMTDITIGHLGANGIVGGHMGIAVGAGLYSKMSKNDAVTVCFFGDGAATEGVFHEALNMAAVWKLPVVFVCENNQYAMSLPWSMSTVQPRFDLRAQAYGIYGADVDGQAVLAVYGVARDAVERARRGEGPTLIGAHTFRYLGHSRGDPSAYRSKQEETDWYARDPITLFQAELMSRQVLTDEQVNTIEQRISAELDQAVQFAEASPLAPVESAFQDVYA